MRLLVTGGAGFIGSNFILFWMKNHPEDIVVNLDVLTYAGNLENLQSVENVPNYKFVKGDITDTKLVQDLMQSTDTVVHFAAESHVDRSILEPAPFVKTNIVGTYTLLEAARKCKIKRFHHISTDEVFGSLELDDKSKFSERTPYRPRSPYSASKAGSDHLVNSYGVTFGVPITITNCSNNFGPYQFPEKFIPLAITNLIEGKKIPIYGNGENIRDWLYVEDHCRAIEKVLISGKEGETYLVGGTTEDTSNLEVIKKILGIMGQNEGMVEFVKDRPGHDRKYALDWTKMRKELDWQPLHSFDEWLRKTVEWYQENRVWWQKVKNGDYRHYYHKQYVDRVQG